MKKLIVLFALLMSASGFAQTYSDVALQNSPGNYARIVPSAPVRVCAATDTVVPCPTLVTTYTDQTLTTACTLNANAIGAPTSGVGCNNPGVADANGNYTFFLTSGNYRVCVFSQNYLCELKGTSGTANVTILNTPNQTTVTTTPSSNKIGLSSTLIFPGTVSMPQGFSATAPGIFNSPAYPTIAQVTDPTCAYVYAGLAQHCIWTDPNNGHSYFTVNDGVSSPPINTYLMPFCAPGGAMPAGASGVWDAVHGCLKWTVAAGVLPAFAGYTFNVTGSTVNAVNNVSGAVDYSGTDAALVIRSAIANISSTCGLLYFKNGTYNLNSLLQENTGSQTNYFAIGFPSVASAGQYCQWIIEGETATPPMDQFGQVLQTSGVLFNVTATAISSVPANVKIMGLWSRPDPVLSAGASIFGANFDVRFPTNQRGCETAIDMTYALNMQLHNVIADFAITQGSLAVPVAGSCTTTGSDLVGITSTSSGHEQSLMEMTYAFGYNIGFDIQAEHTALNQVYAAQTNYGFAYGLRSQNGIPIGHQGYWSNIGCGEVIRCLTIGTHVTNGALLNINMLDMEDSTASLYPTFQPVYHAAESQAGSFIGTITYERTLAGAGITPLSYLFDGGGGNNFTLFNSGISATSNNAQGADNFTRANGSLGSKWAMDATTLSQGAFSITSNAVFCGSATTTCAAIWVNTMSSQAQFSQITVGTVSTGSLNAIVMGIPYTTIEPPIPTDNFYTWGANTTGWYISKWVANVQSVLVGPVNPIGQTGMTTGQVATITAVPNSAGTAVTLNGYINGVLLATATDSTSPFFNGWPGIQTNLNTSSITAWSGGSLPPNYTTLGNLRAGSLGTLPNCTAVGSAANPSVAACGASSAGVVSCATNASTGVCTVNTTAVTAQSEVFVQQRTDVTTGTRLGVTCNATKDSNSTSPQITIVVSGISFSFQLGTITTNPECFSYEVIN